MSSLSGLTAVSRRSHASGQRNRLVTIQALTESVGASEFPIEAWVTLIVAMPASRVDIRSNEALQVGQVAASQQTRWEMHYRPDMDPELVDVPGTRRLLYQGRVQDIMAASVIGLREGLELITRMSSQAAT